MSRLASPGTSRLSASPLDSKSWDGMVTDESMSRISRLMHRWAGVTLESSKSYLVRNRLANLMRERQLTRLEELLDLAERRENTKIRDRIVDALTTHETLFFRDGSPFQAMAKQVIPELVRKAGMKPTLRIWSAGCSSGQEPYSVAMMLIETIPMIDNWDIQIVASDVSPGIIDVASSGVFQEHEMTRGLTPSQRTRFFRKVGDGYKISDQIRKMVDFQVRSLLDDPGPPGSYDILLCRNVLIYFNDADLRSICKSLSNRLKPGGKLFVGSSEVLRGKTNDLVLENIGGVTAYRAAVTNASV